MPIIKKYVVKEFLKIFLLCLAAVVCLYLVVDIFERLNSFIHYRAPLGLAVLYFIFKIPNIIFQVTPVVILLTTLFTLGTMARYNELTAMRASGISLLQIVMPVIALSGLIGAALVVADEVIVSPARYQAEQIKEVHIKKRQRQTFFKKDQLWYHNGDRIYYVKKFDPDMDILRGVTILTFNSQFGLVSRLDSAWAQWQGDSWRFYQVSLKSFSDGKVIQENTYPERVIAIPETPQTFKAVEKKAEEMSFSELRRLARKVKEQGYDATKLRADMHAKLSFPLSSLVMVFLGIPFALKTGRSKGIALGVGISLFISFVYWLTFSLSLALGRAGALPPFVATWLANALFLLLALWLYLNVRQ